MYQRSAVLYGDKIELIMFRIRITLRTRLVRRCVVRLGCWSGLRVRLLFLIRISSHTHGRELNELAADFGWVGEGGLRQPVELGSGRHTVRWKASLYEPALCVHTSSEDMAGRFRASFRFVRDGSHKNADFRAFGIDTVQWMQCSAVQCIQHRQRDRFAIVHPVAYARIYRHRPKDYSIHRFIGYRDCNGVGDGSRYGSALLHAISTASAADQKYRAAVLL